jgi:hypothetical protein
MRNSSHALSFGANLGFAHMHCATCGEERLHRYCKCVSCHTLHPSGNHKHVEWTYQTGSRYRPES